MVSLLGQVLIQALYYAIWGGMVIAAVSVVLRGFFWKYLRVRTSFGRLVLVKVSSTLRDHFYKGWVEDGCLVYETKENIIRIVLPKDKPIFYRCLAVNWIDVDEEKHYIKSVDGTAIPGYDAATFSDLISRALMRPQPNNTKEKLIIFGALVVIILLLVTAYLSYMNYAQIKDLLIQFPELARSIKGVVTTGNISI